MADKDGMGKRKVCTSILETFCEQVEQGSLTTGNTLTIGSTPIGDSCFIINTQTTNNYYIILEVSIEEVFVTT